MGYNLFLDDTRQPRDVKWIRIPFVSWTVVCNYTDFISVVEKRGIPDHISFDHDLGKFAEKTGFDCAAWFCKYYALQGHRFPEYTVHSTNPAGKDRIIALIESFKQNHIK